jgi:hypothetical protein
MERYTPRQFDAHLAWLDAQWNRPDLTQHYLAMIALQVARSNASKPGRIKLKDFIMKFTEPEVQRKPMTEEQKRQVIAETKARWLASVGLSPITGKPR